jgi:hypothetical protein
MVTSWRVFAWPVWAAHGDTLTLADQGLTTYSNSWSWHRGRLSPAATLRPLRRGRTTRWPRTGPHVCERIAVHLQSRGSPLIRAAVAAGADCCCSSGADAVRNFPDRPRTSNSDSAMQHGRAVRDLREA